MSERPQPELETNNREQSGDGKDAGVKNLLDILFKSSFISLSFLALFLKKNSFFPSKKAQEAESGFKRWNSVRS